MGVGAGAETGGVAVVVVAAAGETGFASPSAAAARVDGTGVASSPAAAVVPVGEDEEGAAKNDVILFCFCFLTVEAGIEPGSLRFKGVDISSAGLYLFILSYYVAFFCW